MQKPNITPGKRHFTQEPNGMFQVWADDDTGVCECHRLEDAQAIAALPDLLSAMEAMHSRTWQLDTSATHDGLANCEAMAKMQAAMIKAGCTF